jgi:hypothetical protein
MTGEKDGAECRLLVSGELSVGGLKTGNVQIAIFEAGFARTARGDRGGLVGLELGVDALAHGFCFRTELGLLGKRTSGKQDAGKCDDRRCADHELTKHRFLPGG